MFTYVGITRLLIERIFLISQDRNVSCGQHKREILRQLCELAKAEPSTQQDTNPPIRHHIVADEEKDSIVHQKIRVSQRDDEPNTYEGNEVVTDLFVVFLSDCLLSFNGTLHQYMAFKQNILQLVS